MPPFVKNLLALPVRTKGVLAVSAFAILAILFFMLKLATAPSYALLSSSIQSLSDSQTQASSAAQALATGEATDPTAVVMAVERAQLAMQLASQIRTKAVEAAQDIFHTQV